MRLNKWSGSLFFFTMQMVDFCIGCTRFSIYNLLLFHQNHNQTQNINIVNGYTMSNKQNYSKINNIANHLQPHLPRCLFQKKQDPKSLAEFQQALLQIHHNRNSTQNGYEKVISALEQVIDELFQRNDFLTQERQNLIKDNYELRKKVQSLTSIIEVKQRLGESVIVQNQQIFQILVQTGSISKEISKSQLSYQDGKGIENILQENPYMANKQQIIITSYPLSQNISQNEECEISMSNIGRTPTVHPLNLQTPGLYRQNIYIQCNWKQPQGAIRAFYLSVMQKKSTSKHLIEIIESLKHDMTTIIFEPYPTNQFWTEMLCNFLKITHDGHFDTQVEVLQYIKIHRLIDTLMIKCLKSRIEFLFNNNDSFEMPSTVEILAALANEFGLRMEPYQGQYIFFTKQIKDENLLLSERASLQISLNNKDQNIVYAKEEQPCFSITERQDYLQFSFFIIVQCELGISQYQITDGPFDKQSFKYSEENHYLMQLEDNEGHSAGPILNEKDMNIFQCSEKKLTRKLGHRRYTQQSPKQHKEPLNSSRFFLNRVASKNSNFDQGL